MNKDTNMWFVGDEEPQGMAMHSFPSERDLQTFLEGHSEVLGDLIIIGRYVETDGHGELDLVAIDGSARLWVIELKNLSATRKIMEQTLGYTSWAESASVRKLENLYAKHLDGASLKQDFEERYGRSLPCRDDLTVLVAIVAFKIDDHAHCQLLTLARHDFPVRAYEYGLSYGAGGPVFPSKGPFPRTRPAATRRSTVMGAVLSRICHDGKSTAARRFS